MREEDIGLNQKGRPFTPPHNSAPQAGFSEDLRLRAEQRVTEEERAAQESLSLEELRKLVHELRVERLALAIQNEALLKKEEELESSRAHYFDLYELAPVGYLALAGDGLVLEANLTAAAILGVTRSALNNQPLAQFIHPEDQALYHLRCRQLAAPADAYELRLLRPDAAPFWARLETREDRDVEGKPVLRIAVSDITKTKQSEQSLQESQALFSTFMLHLPCAAFIKDARGRTLFANRFLQDLLNFQKWEGRTTQELLPDDVAERMVEHDQQALAQGLLKVQETVVDLQGRKRTFETIKFAIAAGAESAHLGGIAFDITEHKQAEQEKAALEIQNWHLQKSESLGRMAGAVAHHYNNQLGAVMLSLDLAMQMLPQPSDLAELLAETMDATRRAAEVSRLMLAYLGQSPGRVEPLDLSTLCRQTFPILQAATPESALQEPDLASPGPRIRANADQIQQTLTNLVTNAWEAGKARTNAIQVSVTTLAAKEIPTRHRFPINWQANSPEYACLRVTDTGAGIDQKNLGNIFDPFFSTKFAGRGLGLAVVLGIVKAHSGCVTVLSEPNQGSDFQVFLPVCTELVSQQPSRSGQRLDFKGHGTVLLVDDMAMLRTVAARSLATLGFHVLEATDGLEAVEVFKRHQQEIRFVLCDLVMPRMDGWETLSALRRLAPHVPVILSSGYEEEQAISKEHPDQPNAFLGKPYKIQQLQAAIARVLPLDQS
jgi:two-component system cell cycle sensor histidine kinase/response regulator CckA